LDLGNLEGGAVAEDEIGLAGFGGDKFAVGGEVDNVGALGEEAVFEAFAGEVAIEPGAAGEAAGGGALSGENALEFGGDEGEAIEAAGGAFEGDGLGEAEAEDFGLVREFVFGVGELGSEDVGEGEALDQVLLAVVEGGHGNVVGGAIGYKDQVFDFIFAEFGLEFFGEEALIELFACLLDGVEVVGGLEGSAELTDEFGELGFAEGTFGLAEDSAFGGPEDAGFVLEDEGIDQDGVGLGGNDAFGAGNEGFGAFVDRGAALLFFFSSRVVRL
jgi:hypothetical protein